MIVLAIDPGRDKSGIAVVDDNLKVYEKTIISSKKINEYLHNVMDTYKIDLIVLGDGTTSGKMKLELQQNSASRIPVTMVDEHNSTLAAEARYRRDHPLQGWKKLLKFISWSPEAAVDDYVAVILAERYLKDEEG